MPRKILGSKSSWQIVALALGAMLAATIPVALLAGAVQAVLVQWRDPLLELPLGSEPRTVPVSLPTPGEFEFVLHTGSLHSKRCTHLRVEVALLLDGQSFSSFSYDRLFSRPRRLSSRSTTLDHVQLPASGVDAIQASARFEPDGCGGEIDSAVLQVYGP